VLAPLYGGHVVETTIRHGPVAQAWSTVLVRARGPEVRPSDDPRDDATTRAARIEDAVARIPPGFVRTYGDVDRAAPRLVGQVLARTTRRLPWHRVVRADGSLPIGEEQASRLRREGVPFKGLRVDLSVARLPPE
jgi:methylated-DNA-protein-cysteine methyltransferase-like protein